jgi:pyruvate formate lyase activating enzyme
MSVHAPPPATSVPSVLAERLPDGSVRCGVCAHRCLVRPGRHGICGVRENVDGVLRCHAYGAVAALGLDPIEKKPLFHVDPGSLSYSIATLGCPFHCRFCQNWEIAQAPRLGLDLPTRPLRPDQVVAEARRAGARSIAYTYVEPTVFLEYVLDTGRLARPAGLLGLYVSNGYATPEAVALLADVIDAANIDVKSFDDAFYRRHCGARLAPILDSLVAMRRAGIWLEVTTLVIPGLTDDPAGLRSLTAWIVEALGADTPWHVSRFFPAHRMVDVPPTPLTTLGEAAAIGQAAGLRYVYVGNAPELGLETTTCAGCGERLLERHGYRTVRRLTPAGTCPRCSRPLPGLRLATTARGPVMSAQPCG